MRAAEDKNLSLIESELKSIRRTAEHSSDYETADYIGRAVASALQALSEYKLNIEPACEDIPAGVHYPAAA